jgi:3-hydroxybutyryl-CoA dehydratase
VARFSVGQTASFSKTVTEHDVIAFSDLIGDKNPIHLDEAYAKQTRFGARIAHGAFTFGVISAAIGNKLPGNGSVYMSQSIKFLKPVFLGDTITATVEITAIRSDKGIVTQKTVCANQRGETIADGEAVSYHPDAKTE